MLFKSQHETLLTDAKSAGDTKLTAMFGAYQRAWHMLTPDQQYAALRGSDCSTPDVPGQAGNINDDCNTATRKVLGIREAVDEFMADGKLDQIEGRKLRRLCDIASKACATVGCHGNESTSLSA